MSVWERVVEANRPGPPEHSRVLRASSVAAVVVAAGACWHEGVLSGAAGRAAYDLIVRAVDDARAGTVDAVATAPVNK